MTDLDAITIIEGDGGETYDERVAAWQHLIDTGVVWQLQGNYGRTARDLIDSGICEPEGAAR